MIRSSGNFIEIYVYRRLSTNTSFKMRDLIKNINSLMSAWFDVLLFFFRIVFQKSRPIWLTIWWHARVCACAYIFLLYDCLTVKSDKSDCLKIIEIFFCACSKITTGQRSRFLVLIERSVASGDENVNHVPRRLYWLRVELRMLGHQKHGSVYSRPHSSSFFFRR